MIKKMTELNEALPEILFLDGIYLLAGEIIILLLLSNPAVYAFGFFSGVVYSVFCVFHMSFRIRKIVYGRADARKTMVLGYMVRLIVMIALFMVLYFFNIGDLLTALIGMFAMKVSAYLQPAVHAIFSKIIKKGG